MNDDKCPKCGAAISEDDPYEFECGSFWTMDRCVRGDLSEGRSCLARRLAAMTERAEKAEAGQAALLAGNKRLLQRIASAAEACRGILTAVKAATEHESEADHA